MAFSSPKLHLFKLFNSIFNMIELAELCVCVCVCARIQSHPTLCSPIDCSPPDSSVHGFPRQEYWSGLPFPTPGDLPKPGIELESLMSPALAGGFLITCATSNDPPIPPRYSWWVWKSDLWPVWGSRTGMSLSLWKWAAVSGVESKGRMQSLCLECLHRGPSPRGWQVCRRDSAALRLGRPKTPTAHHRLVHPAVSTELLLTFNPVILAGTPSWVTQPWTDPLGPEKLPLKSGCLIRRWYCSLSHHFTHFI